MDPFGAVGLPGQRALDRVAVPRLGAGFTLGEADGPATGDVHRGQQHKIHRLTIFGAVGVPLTVSPSSCAAEARLRGRTSGGGTASPTTVRSPPPRRMARRARPTSLAEGSAALKSPSPSRGARRERTKQREDPG